METQELQIVTPTELTEVLSNTKIELSKAEQHAVAFAPSMQEYLTLSKEINGLDKLNPSEADAKKARETRLKMVKVRTGAEEIKDIRKEGIKAEGDLIQSLFNVVKNSCLVTEAEFTEIEKHQERQEAKRKAELAEARTLLLEPFGTDTTYLPLNIMTNEQFNWLLENEQLAANARKEQAEKAQQARIEAERFAEENRLAEIKRQEEEREAQRLENERLRKEKEEREAAEIKAMAKRESDQKKFKEYSLKGLYKLGFADTEGGVDFGVHSWFIGSNHYSYFEKKEEADEWLVEIQTRLKTYQEKADAEALLAKERESAAKEAKKQADAADKLRKEQQSKLDAANKETARIQAELKDKQDAEQKAIADAKAKEESDAKEREAAEKAALLAPDKEKVRSLFEAIKAIAIPEFTTVEGKAIGKLVSEELTKLTKSVIIESKKLV